MAVPARHAMDDSVQLVAHWARFDTAAWAAARRVEQALDAYCDAGGEAPAPTDVRAAARLRFIANHRLRWILFQTRRAQARLRLV